MAKTMVETESGDQTIEQLQARYRDLHTKKIQADTNLENATNNLAALKEEARQKFGTDNVDELREKLEAMKAENEEKRKNVAIHVVTERGQMATDMIEEVKR